MNSEIRKLVEEINELLVQVNQIETKRTEAMAPAIAQYVEDLKGVDRKKLRAFLIMVDTLRKTHSKESGQLDQAVQTLSYIEHVFEAIQETGGVFEGYGLIDGETLVSEIS